MTEQTENIIVESSVEQTGPVTRKVSVSISPDEVTKELDSQYSKIRKSSAIKGFRKGKAPMNIIKRYYADQVEIEVKSNLIGRIFKDIIEKHDIQMVAEPQIERADIVEDNTLEADIIFEVRPEIEAKDYMGFDLVREPLNVLDAAIEQRLENIRQQHATLEPIEEERGAETGDVVEIDFVGTIDGVEFPGGKAEGHDLELGSGRFIPGFEDGIIGMKSGETKDLTITFPEDYPNTDLASKEAVFKVTAQSIKSKNLPDLDDEFAKDLGGDFEGIEDVRNRIRKDIELAETNRIRRADRKNVLDYLLTKNEFEVPPSLVHQQVHNMMEGYGYQLQMAGLNNEQITEMLKGSETRFLPDAELEVKASFLFEAIAKQEGFEVTDEDADARIEKMAGDSGRPKEAVAATYAKDSAMARLKDDILEDKVLDFLIENANVTFEEPVGEGSATKKEATDEKAETESE